MLGSITASRPPVLASILGILSFFAIQAISLSAQSLPGSVAAQLDGVVANYYKPDITVAFGTFTYGDTGLPSLFSRWLEEGLAASIAGSSRLHIFNTSAAAAMDPAFRAIYGGLFKSASVDALLSGRYYDEGQEVRTRLELTSLSDGLLIGTVDFDVPKAKLPPAMGLAPSDKVAATAASLQNLAPSAEEQGELRVSVSTDRGPGAVYREGENLIVLVTVNEDAWIKVYHVDVNGQVQLIWPNRFESGRRIQAGQLVRIPGSDSPFAFKMTPPFGTEFIKVIASTRKFDSTEEAFTTLNGNARELITRGWNVADPSEAQRAEAMASYVIMPAK
jgi:hypothetical protein